MALLRALLLGWALLWAASASAQELRPVPPLSGRVIDQTATLSAAQAEALTRKLAAFEAEAGPQIVVLLVPGTAPEDIAAYAQRVADSWKIGRREVGDGLLVVVAKDERKLRIEVAKALEGAVPDLAARQVIDQVMRPAFRQNDYAGGLNAGVDRLMQRVRGEGLPAPAARAAKPGLQLEELGIFLFVAVPVVASVLGGLFGRKLGSLLTAGAAGGIAWWLTASLLLAAGVGVVALLLAGVLGLGSALRGLGGRRGGGGGVGWGGGGWNGGGGSGSWSSGSGGGGGFSSGGGGDFGGGGASGDW